MSILKTKENGKTKYYKMVNPDPKTHRRVEITKAEYALLQASTPLPLDEAGDYRFLDSMLKSRKVYHAYQNLNCAEIKYLIERENSAKYPRLDLLEKLKTRLKDQKKVEDARKPKVAKKKTSKKKTTKKTAKK